MQPRKITIVGGGIGGMTAATALAQAGFSVNLLETASAFGEIGAGVTLSPNAMKGLDYIGVCEEVAASGMEPSKQRVQHWQDGRILAQMERADARTKYGAPYVTIHRADLHEILVRSASKAGAQLQTAAAVSHIEGTTAILVDGRTIEGDIVIGADGLKSVVRKLFEPIQAHYTGHVAWRSLVAVEGPLKFLAEWPGIHIGPERMIARYPVRGGKLLNIVFFARQTGWNEDGWTIPADPESLFSIYAGWCDEVQAMIGAARKEPMFKWAINARRPLRQWSKDGNVVLLGDAAHAMTPFLGHGAACAIEDAIVLARALENSSDSAEGLLRYVEARHERASFIQSESNANADRMQQADSAMFGMEEMRDEESLGLFEYDCRTVTV